MENWQTTKNNDINSPEVDLLQLHFIIEDNKGVKKAKAH